MNKKSSTNKRKLRITYHEQNENRYDHGLRIEPKSSANPDLTNALVGEKIAIVSNKPQATRNRIYGVVNRGDTQYVLLDTPGFHKARNRLGDYMVKVTREIHRGRGRGAAAR